MCWFSRYTPYKQIAETDIVCYKVFLQKDIILEHEEFPRFRWGKILALYSIGRKFKFIPYQKQKSVDITIKIYTYPKYYIDEGYDSYETLDRAKIGLLTGMCVIKCTIPKGDEYYINESQEIVSSNIIITDKIVYTKIT